MEYYKLTDTLNNNEVVKCNGNNYCVYSCGMEEWIPTNIFTQYLCLDSEFFGKFVSISEDEAIRIINEKRTQLNDLLKLAYNVAKEAHTGQLDKGGNDYFNHPQAVSNALYDTEHKIVAYLHDVVEDTATTLQNLADLGFTSRIVKSVGAISKTKGVSYEKYLEQVKQDSNARYVKIEDIKHNMELKRIANPTEKDFARLKKYQKALIYLDD